MSIEMIVAMSENRVIGIDQQLPWRLSGDLKHFKHITMGKAILMGRATFESIGHPLSGRTNIVLTSDPAYVAPGCAVVNSIDEALEMSKVLDDLVVIGGAKVYQQFMDKVDVIHLTLVHTQLDGDAYFPEFDENDWEEALIAKHEPDEKNNFGFSFKQYKKKHKDSSLLVGESA
jgi:dihydrofolate reductase